MTAKAYCVDCPDRETCHIGAACDFVRGVNAIAIQYGNLLKGKNIMTKNTTPADVAAKAAEEKLVSAVPAQGEKSEKDADVKSNPVEGQEAMDEVAEETKKTLKDRVSALLSKVKENKKFLAGVVAGSVGTALVMGKLAKDKVEEVVETEDDTTDESAA